MELSKQESKYHAEKSHVEREIVSVLTDLVNADWDSNTLKSQIQELMKKRFCVEQQLYKLNEPLLISQYTTTKMKRKTKSKLTHDYLK
ncbi:MAG: hypothetical protein HW410_85 [Nitrosarchaeum sp.]|jgi:hypothetical protein|nr:hypothetical protein [Nitrosarchaeum sp.]